MRGNFLRMLGGAMVKEDGASADDEVLKDNAAESEIARSAAHIGFSDVVLENQEPIDNDASKKAKTLRMLGIFFSSRPPASLEAVSNTGPPAKQPLDQSSRAPDDAPHHRTPLSVAFPGLAYGICQTGTALFFFCLDMRQNHLHFFFLHVCCKKI
jgi:hypothetical protein